MNREAALASLGLSGNEDGATIARTYGERLSVVQEQLVKAQTDSDRSNCQTKLSELVEAYEFVTATGRYTNSLVESGRGPFDAPGERRDSRRAGARADDANATVMRSDAGPAPPSADTAIRMEPGAVLSDRLEIGALLGQGGMGNVYAARDRLKNEDVAIKVLRQDLLFSAAAKDRFLAEAKVSCSLSHPNIVRVHDVGLSGNYYYFSMERLKGHTLRQRIDAYHRGGREFGVEEVTDIARQLIDALRYAHRYIVHRDLKPENIWLAEDGTVKLMDFGIARAYSSSQLTQTGITLGTAYYMAPEQRVAAKDVDWRADQYSLGVVLYELLAGTLPTGAVKPLEVLRADLPKRYARALMRAMAPKPDDRFASLAEMLTEITAPERKMAIGMGGMLLIAASLAAVAAGTLIIWKKEHVQPSATQVSAAASPPTEPQPSSLQPVSNAVEKPAEPTPAPAKRVATVDKAPAISRMRACIDQCVRDDGECRSLSRRGKQDCMRAVAFGSSGRLTTTNPAAASCAFFGQSRCDRSFNREACVIRMTERYKDCVNVLGGNMAARRQDCEDKSRESDRLCMDELRDCRAACE